MPTLNAISPRQARTARAALSLSVRVVADRSGISDSSIRRIEEGQASLDLRVRLQHWYESQGLRFAFGPEVRGVMWEE